MHCDLQSLTLSAGAELQLTATSMAAIASVTALTRLELASFTALESVEQLHSLGLAELVLKYCKNWERALFVPGALMSLRRLHVEDSLSLKYRHSWEGEPEASALSHRDWLDTWSILLRLPQLCELSGCCKLFEVGLRESSRSWRDRMRPELPFQVADVAWKHH